MADYQPENALEDELLSAYVDGELDGEELARVEQRLQNDPAARQLVDELRVLSSTIQSLPRESVEQDIHAAVLQRAEQTIASGREQLPANPRRWGWAVMALAAALLLMFFQEEPNQDVDSVASVDRESASTDKPRLELRAPAGPVEEEDTTVTEGITLGASVREVDANRATMNADSSSLSEPVQVVHVDVSNGIEEFDRLLVSNQVRRVANQGQNLNRFARSRSQSSSLGRRLEAASKPTEEPVPAEEVLVEGTVGQIQQLVLACQNDTTRYNNVQVEDIRFDQLSAGKAPLAKSVDAVKAVEQASQPQQLSEENNRQSQIASPQDKQKQATATLTDPTAADSDEGQELDTSVAEMVEQIRVLFVLYTNPQSGPTVPAKKKANSGIKRSGKAG